MVRHTLTFKECIDLISYDPNTGTFTNKFGNQVGSYSRKYGRLIICGQQVTLSRLAVFKMKGRWPDEEVDHIDKNSHNDKWDNLRECSRHENMRNQDARKTNKTGYRGVYRSHYKGTERYTAVSTGKDSKRVYLGVFRSPEGAAIAYDNFVKSNHGAFASLNFKENV